MPNTNSDQVIHNLSEAIERYQEIMVHLMHGNGTFMPMSLVDQDKNRTIFTSALEQFSANPEKFFNLNVEYIEKFQNLVSTSINRFIGGEAHPIYAPSPKDRRFKDKTWEDNALFDFIKQFYLMSSEWVEKSVQQYELSPELKKYLKFATHQFIDAVAPTNSIFCNPQVLRESLDNGWENIVKGLDRFLEDIKNSEGVFNIPTTEKTAFKVGENIATTPGKVVFQNELMQLICYEPKNKTFRVPLLIVPPLINKYYILDLSKNNSLVKFLVDNNFQLFLISWVNPDQKLAHKNFEDYLKEGILDSCEFLSTLGYKEINAVGYCIGGTLLATAAAYMKSSNLNLLNSVSFFNTLLDFENPGEMEIFINEPSIAAIENEINSKGYFDGRYLANSFSLLRANDLIWSFFINNYLLAKAPAPLDLLYWNSDPTNLPAKMYSYYLRNMYLNNLLKSKNSLKMFNTPIDLASIDYPSFFLAASEDHIAPWKSVYNGSKLLQGSKVFCLTTSGHVAGVVNPPTNTKYSYKIGRDLGDNAEEWSNSAVGNAGSWWNSWKDWLSNNSKGLQESLDYNSLAYIELAPGKYVQTCIA